MLLLLARHGETVANRQKRFQGHRDYPLTDQGAAQARLLQVALKPFNVKAVYSSDLGRARRTALLAAAPLKRPLYFHPLFREYGFGILEGLTLPEVTFRYPSLGKGFRQGFPGSVVPGAEDTACFNRRLRMTGDYFSTYSRGEVCLLVSHGRFINAFLSLLILGRDRPPYPFPAGNASLSAVTLEEGGAELLFFNDTCHLEK